MDFVPSSGIKTAPKLLKAQLILELFEDVHPFLMFQTEILLTDIFKCPLEVEKKKFAFKRLNILKLTSPSKKKKNALALDRLKVRS